MSLARLPTELLKLTARAPVVRSPALGSKVKRSFKPGDSPDSLRHALAQKAHNGMPTYCLGILAELSKHQGVPIMSDYANLMQAFARTGLFNETLQVLDDAEEYGLQPNIECYNWLLLAAILAERPLMPIFTLMKDNGLHWNSMTFQFLIYRSLKSENLEESLHLFNKARSEGFTLDIKTISGIVTLACSLSEPRVAFDLVNYATQTFSSGLTDTIYLNLLECCTDTHFQPGLELAFDHLADQRKAHLIEGTLLAVLETSGRAGNVRICRRCIELLNEQNIARQEYHVAPLIEALARQGDISQAVSMIENMSTVYDCSPTEHTADPIVKAILKRYDSQTASELEAVKSIREAIDIVYSLRAENLSPFTVNILIAANVEAGYLHRAHSLYKEFLSSSSHSKSFRPNVHTFNLLLRGCVAAKYKELAESLLNDLKTFKVAPTQDTYELLIELYLTCSGESEGRAVDYQSAMGYLQALKQRGGIPSISIYTLFMRRLPETDVNRRNQLLNEVADLYRSGVRNRLSHIKSRQTEDLSDSWEDSEGIPG